MEIQIPADAVRIRFPRTRVEVRVPVAQQVQLLDLATHDAPSAREEAKAGAAAVVVLAERTVGTPEISNVL